MDTTAFQSGDDSEVPDLDLDLSPDPNLTPSQHGDEHQHDVRALVEIGGPAVVDINIKNTIHVHDLFEVTCGCRHATLAHLTPQVINEAEAAFGAPRLFAVLADNNGTRSCP
jgi:hypothetical protein